MDVSCHRPFLPGTSLEPAVIPPHTLQASHCSAFRIMCDVLSTAVFVVNLSNVFLVQLPYFSLIISLLFQCLQLLLLLLLHSDTSKRRINYFTFSNFQPV